MVVPRNEKQSYIGSNLRYLRKNTGNTLEEMAELLSLKGKSSYYAYEENTALPDIHKLLKLASYFDVSIEDLVYTDIPSSKKEKISPDTKVYEVELVPVTAAAGYGKEFGDTVFVNKLKKIKIPYKPYGIARAFEIEGDSMEPDIKDRSAVIGIKIGKGEIKHNRTYIVVTDRGPICKNIRLSEDGDLIYLISRNEKYAPKHIRTDEVRELWEVWKKDISIKQPK